MNQSLSVGCRAIKKYVSIGECEEERKLKCLIELNCRIDVDMNTAEFLGQPTFNYLNIIEVYQKASLQSYILLEDLGNAILKQLRQDFSGILSGELELIKHYPVISSNCGSVYMIMRF